MPFLKNHLIIIIHVKTLITNPAREEWGLSFIDIIGNKFACLPTEL